MDEKLYLRFKKIGEPFRLEFIEAEDALGRGINAGEWIHEQPGETWILEIDLHEVAKQLKDRTP